MKDSTKGIITILLSNLLMTAGALLIKAVPESVSGFYRILFTCAFSLVIGVPILFVLRDKTRPRNIKFLLLRGFFGAIPMTLFFLAVSYSGVGRATLLSTTYPVFSAVYGYFFFKERAGASVWIGAILSAENRQQLFIPGGFAHGFIVLSEYADVIYKCDDYYNPGDDYGVLWNDPDLEIDWPEMEAILSEKDAVLPRLRDVPPEKLPE